MHTESLSSCYHYQHLQQLLYVFPSFLFQFFHSILPFLTLRPNTLRLCSFWSYKLQVESIYRQSNCLSCTAFLFMWYFLYFTMNCLKYKHFVYNVSDCKLFSPCTSFLLWCNIKVENRPPPPPLYSIVFSVLKDK